MKNWLLLILLLLPSIAFGQTTQVAEATTHGLSTDRLSTYETFLISEIDQQHIPGAISLVFRNGEVAHRKSFGLSDLSDQTPMSLNNIFYIQSMTKPIISVAFMMLYEEGHFFLDDPVSKYLPEFENLQVAGDPEQGTEGNTEPLTGPIRIYHLLSHTAGFSHGLGMTKLDQEYMQAMYLEKHATVQDRVKRMLELPLYGQPAAQWYYSASPDVLSVLIEHFSGKSTEEFLQQRIFDPLGMKDTGYNLSKDQRSRVVTLHMVDSTGQLIESPRQPPSSGNTIYSGVNGLWSTADDYLKFARMMLNNGSLDGKRYLSRKTVELMTQNHIGDLMQPGSGFGLGFGVTTDVAASKSVGSKGTYYWSGAFCTYFIIDPEEQMVAILMTQLAPYSQYYANKMRQLVYPAIDD